MAMYSIDWQEKAVCAHHFCDLEFIYFLDNSFEIQVGYYE